MENKIKRVKKYFSNITNAENEINHLSNKSKEKAIYISKLQNTF